MLQNGMDDEVRKAIKQQGLKLEIRDGKLIDTNDFTTFWLDKFITVHPAMLTLKDDVRKLSKVNDSVLITGETGTGKELIARALHGTRQGKFIALNCAGLPENLIESEMFGYVPGAFTGARARGSGGLMSAAEDGTLFLDEMGELPLLLQAKLLRAIQEKKIRKVGGEVEIDINCRIVCATHRDVTVMVESGVFRRDLYARISTFELHIEPLRRRQLDIIHILSSMDGGRSFIEALNKSLPDKVTSKSIHEVDTFVSKLHLNVRSLQQMVIRYKVLGKLP